MDAVRSLPVQLRLTLYSLFTDYTKTVRDHMYTTQLPLSVMLVALRSHLGALASWPCHTCKLTEELRAEFWPCRAVLERLHSV